MFAPKFLAHFAISGSSLFSAMPPHTSFSTGFPDEESKKKLAWVGNRDIGIYNRPCAGLHKIDDADLGRLDLLIKAFGNKPRVVGFAFGAELSINAFAGISRQHGILWQLQDDSS
ncbi:hypothetical protein LOF22_30585 [Sinorhizobium meliloti]|nr:hypothetical protein [Sinorhizobium meliloti]MCO6425610.1 hypothetical protein [Sinorhizobium meliloti]MDE4549349.1 hypothetical protein [Sinorhizobium meliloti]MDE4569638.1 hypothetical protein [Sinorhizobium meliloti]